MNDKSETCNCQACAYGLWCADGQRGVFLRGESKCQRPECGDLAWRHSSRPTRCEKK